MAMANRLAVDGGQPVRRKPWPPSHVVDCDDEKSLVRALHQESWSNDLCVRTFESRFAEFCSCRHALLVTNATHALKLALLSTGIGPGDEVVIPGVTWPSVAIAVMECGADPIPADIDPGTYAMTRESIQSVLSDRTRAIIPTHLFCSQVDLPPILELARSRRLVVIEDAAHAVGARRHGTSLGTIGAIGVFSFNQKKLLACGEGGCLVTNDDDLYQTALRLREIQTEVAVPLPCIVETSKVSEFQAAILLSQLDKLPSRVSLADKHLEVLRSRLRQLTNIQVLDRLPGTDIQPAYSFCFRVKGARDITWFRAALAAELGLQISGAYKPLSETMAVNASRDLRYSHLGNSLRSRLPNSIEAHYREAVRFSGAVLCSTEEDLLDVVTAITKVVESLPLIRPE